MACVGELCKYCREEAKRRSDHLHRLRLVETVSAVVSLFYIADDSSVELLQRLFLQ